MTRTRKFEQIIKGMDYVSVTFIVFSSDRNIMLSTVFGELFGIWATVHDSKEIN